jgi:hypothetical protein
MTRLVGAVIAGAASLIAASGCARQSASVETQVRASFGAFPFAAQSKDARPWRTGRFTGTCKRSVLTFGAYACIYSDGRGHRGYACFATKPRLKLRRAIGPDERDRWTDHSGRVLPPERVC